jgi:plastocyanin
MKKLLMRLAMVLPLLLLARLPAAADTPAASATVVMTDTGFTPAAVTIQPGGTVTWTNQGSTVHTATTIGGAPLPFNTGGLGSGHSTSMGFSVPGKYYYTSSTDCLNGVYTPQFPCSISFLVEVTSSQVVATSAAATFAALPSTPTPTPTTVPSNLPLPTSTVVINDQGISPASVTIALNGSITWVNQGTTVHSATSPGTTGWKGFDSGGLAVGGIYNLAFGTPGTFTYSSAPDCLFGNKNPLFKCDGYTITVSDTALPQPTTVPTPAPTSVQPLTAPASNTTVTLDDVNGFQPNALTVKAGQIVTWTNKGTQTHTVTSNQDYTPAFDSGGLSGGQSFSYTFTTPGSYGYHSQTDVTYTTSQSCNCVIPVFSFNGIINVTP